jgi:hypothetical protein
MIRDSLIGIILLACLAIAREVLGPTGVLVASAASMIGFLAREVWDRRRRELAERRTLDRMNQNRGRLGLAPIGRASRRRGFTPTGGHYEAELPATPRPTLSFPDHPIIPTRDARFEA